MSRSDFPYLKEQDFANYPAVYVLIGGNKRYVGQAAGQSISLRLSQHFLKEDKAWVESVLFFARADGKMSKADTDSLATASKSCSLNFTHSQVGRMLEKKEYCGDDFYPEIISTEVFEKVQEERLKRATKLGRLNRVKSILAVEPSTKFKMNPCIEKFADPFEQAEYIYSQIESEVQSDEE